MRLILQRTTGVKLFIDNKLHSESGKGLLVLFGTKKGDSEEQLEKLADKTVNLRIFEDDDDKMNLSTLDIKGELMVVSQFTLYANTSKGRRPSFNEAQDPEEAERLYELFIDILRKKGVPVSTGIFGAKMDIRFNNDGPVTILIDHDQ